MKWIKLVIDIALAILPGLALKQKKNLEKELEIAKATIDILTKDKTPQEKGHAVEEALGGLLRLSGVTSSLSKKLDKAKARLYKKLF